MGKIGFIFAGQGAQKVGMGKEFYDNYKGFKESFDKSEKVFSNIKNLCFEGPAEELNRTINTQPCIYGVNIGIANILKEKGITADVCAGFSLGELSALAYSGAYTDEEGLEIVCNRAKFMQEASDNISSSLIAVLGLDDETVIETSKTFEEVYPVNFNCKGQVVVAASEKSSEGFIEKIKSIKGKCMKLPVSGGFHSPFMDDAAINFHNYLTGKTLKGVKVSTYSNYTGKHYEEEIINNLGSQINNPVRWGKIIESMLEEGVDTFVEIGPGNTLSGFVKKTVQALEKNGKEYKVTILNTSDKNNLDNTIAYFGKE